ncbi:hypothetical protein SNEBB_002611 [Seison nebaliae]|nr:hypothetical protein SNEBB_002611 [Seison nebaliae]
MKTVDNLDQLSSTVSNELPITTHSPSTSRSTSAIVAKRTRDEQRRFSDNDELLMKETEKKPKQNTVSHENLTVINNNNEIDDDSDDDDDNGQHKYDDDEVLVVREIVEQKMSHIQHLIQTQMQKKNKEILSDEQVDIEKEDVEEECENKLSLEKDIESEKETELEFDVHSSIIKSSAEDEHHKMEERNGEDECEENTIIPSVVQETTSECCLSSSTLVNHDIESDELKLNKSIIKCEKNSTIEENMKDNLSTISIDDKDKIMNDNHHSSSSSPNNHIEAHVLWLNSSFGMLPIDTNSNILQYLPERNGDLINNSNLTNRRHSLVDTFNNTSRLNPYTGLKTHLVLVSYSPTDVSTTTNVSNKTESTPVICPSQNDTDSTLNDGADLAFLSNGRELKAKFIEKKHIPLNNNICRRTKELEKSLNNIFINRISKQENSILSNCLKKTDNNNNNNNNNCNDRQLSSSSSTSSWKRELEQFIAKTVNKQTENKKKNSNEITVVSVNDKLITISPNNSISHNNKSSNSINIDETSVISGSTNSSTEKKVIKSEETQIQLNEIISDSITQATSIVPSESPPITTSSSISKNSESNSIVTALASDVAAKASLGIQEFLKKQQRFLNSTQKQPTQTNVSMMRNSIEQHNRITYSQNNHASLSPETRPSYDDNNGNVEYALPNRHQHQSNHHQQQQQQQHNDSPDYQNSYEENDGPNGSFDAELLSLQEMERKGMINASRNCSAYTMRRCMLNAKEELECVDTLRKTLENKLKVSLPDDVAPALCDGVVLCHFVNQLRPKMVPSIFVPCANTPKLSLAKCRRNVENFLIACKKMGVIDLDLCSASEIIECKNTIKVARTVSSLVYLCKK